MARKRKPEKVLPEPYVVNQINRRPIYIVREIIYWTFSILIGTLLYFILTTPYVKAAEETILMNVSSSSPYYEHGQPYEKECIRVSNGHQKCFLVPQPPEYYATVFVNGRDQITILTKAQFPHDVWFDVVVDCKEDDICHYKSAIMSEYQSPETMAIDEIITNEQRKYLLNPRRLY